MLKQVDKNILHDVVGILQPMLSTESLEALTENTYSIEAFSTALQTALEDEEITEVVKEAIKRKLYADIAEPLNAIHNLLSSGRYNENILKEPLIKDMKINAETVGITTVGLKSDGNMTGQLAIEAARASIGIRATKKITLFRSGFWIVIGGISTGDIINLEKKLSSVSIDVVNARLGLEYTTDIFIYLEVLLEFVLEHIKATSLDIDPKKVGKFIKLADAEMLYAGIVDAIEPRGFTNYFKCKNVIEVMELKPVKEEEGKDSKETVDENKNTDKEPIDMEETIAGIAGGKLRCDNTFSARLNLQSMLRVASDRLTSNQRLMLLKGKGKLSLKELDTYQNEFDNTTKEVVIEDEEVSLTLILKPATIEETISMGKHWFEKINKSIDTLSVGEDEDERRRLYKKHYNSQALAVFTPYIEAYLINEDSKVDDMRTILNILGEVTENDVLSTKVSEVISTYIDSTLIAIYGVPEFECDTCKKIYNEEEIKESFLGFIPINIRKYFFTLLTLRG